MSAHAHCHRIKQISLFHFFYSFVMSFRLPLQISRAVKLTIKSPNIEQKVPLCTSWVTQAKRSPVCYKNVVAQSEEQQEAAELDASTETNKALNKLRELKKKDENFKWYVDSAYLQPKKIETSGKLPSAIVAKYPGNVSYKGAKKEAPVKRATIRTKVWRGSKTSLRRKYSTHATCAPRKPFKSYSFPLVRGRTKDTGLTPSPSGHRAFGRAQGNHSTGAKRAAAGSRPSDAIANTSKHTQWEYSKRGPGNKPADNHSVSKHIKEVCVEGTVYSERLNKIKKQLFSRCSNVHPKNEETVDDRKEPDFSHGQKRSWDENNHKGEQGNKEKSEKKRKHDENISFDELTQGGGVACAQHVSDKADTVKSKLPRLPENNRAQAHSDDARITFTCKRKSQSQRMEPNKRKYFLPKPNFYASREKTLVRGHVAFKSILTRFDESGRKWKHTINHKIGKSKRRQRENSVCRDCCDRRPMKLGPPVIVKLKPQCDASKLKRKDLCEPETGDQRRADVSVTRPVKKCKLSRATAECKQGSDACTILSEAPNSSTLNPEAECIGKKRIWSYESCKKNECSDKSNELLGMKVTREPHTPLLKSPDFNECCEGCILSSEKPRMATLLGKNVVQRRSLSTLLNSRECVECCEQCPKEPRAPELKRLKPMKITVDRNWKPTDCPHKSCPERMDDVLGLNVVPKKSLPPLLRSENCTKCCDGCDLKPDIPKLKRLNYAKPTIDRSWKSSDCPVGTCSPRIDEVLGLNVIPKKKLPPLLNSKDCVKCCEECNYNPEVPKLKRLSMTPKTDRNWKPSDCPVGSCTPRIDDVLGLNVVTKKTLPSLLNSKDCVKCCEECDYNPEVPKLKRLSLTPKTDRNWKPSDCPVGSCTPRIDDVLGLNVVTKKTLPSLLNSKDCVKCCEECDYNPEVPKLKRLSLTPNTDRNWKPSDCPVGTCSARMDEVLGLNVVHKKKLPSLLNSKDCVKCCEECDYNPKVPQLKRLSLTPKTDRNWKPSDCPVGTCSPRIDEVLGLNVVHKKTLPPLLNSKDCIKCCEECNYNPEVPKLKRLSMTPNTDRNWKPSDCPVGSCSPRIDDVLGLNVVPKKKLPPLLNSKDCIKCCEECNYNPEVPKLKRLSMTPKTDRNWKPSDCPVGMCSPRIDEVLGLNVVQKKKLPSLLNSKDCVKCCEECNYNPEVPKLKRLSMTPKTDRNWKPSDCPVGTCSARMDEVLGLNVVHKKKLPSLLNSNDCVKCCEECDYNPEVPELKRLSLTPKIDRNWKPSDCPVGECTPRMDDLLGLNVTTQKSLPVLPKLENCELCCDGCDLNPEVPKLKRLKSYAPPDRNWKPSDCPVGICTPRMDVLLGLDKIHQKSLPSLLVSEECEECCEDCFFIPEAPVLKRLVLNSVGADRKWKATDCPTKEACTPRMDELLGMNVIKDKKLPTLEITSDCEDCCEDCIFEPAQTPLPRLKAQYDPMNMKKKHKDCGKIDCTTERMDELLGIHVKPKKLPVLLVDDCSNCCDSCLPDSAPLPKLKRLKPKYDPDVMEWKHKACETEKCPPRMDDLLGLNVVQRLKLPNLKPSEDCEDCCESCPQDPCMSTQSNRMPKLTGKKSADVRPGQGNGKYSIMSNCTNGNLPYMYRKIASGPLSTKRAYTTKALKREYFGNSGDRLSTFSTCEQSQDRSLLPVRQTPLQIPLPTESFKNICSVKSKEQKYCQTLLETARAADACNSEGRDTERTRICSTMIEESCASPARMVCKQYYPLEKYGKVPSPYKSFSELRHAFEKSEATASYGRSVANTLTVAAAGACAIKSYPPVTPTCDLTAENADTACSDKDKSLLDRCRTYCKDKIKQRCNSGESFETLDTGHNCKSELINVTSKCNGKDGLELKNHIYSKNGETHIAKLAQKILVCKKVSEMAEKKTNQFLASVKNIRTNIRRKNISTRYTIRSERERIKRKARNRRQRKSNNSRISSRKIAEKVSECPNDKIPYIEDVHAENKNIKTLGHFWEGPVDDDITMSSKEHRNRTCKPCSNMKRNVLANKEETSAQNEAFYFSAIEEEGGRCGNARRSQKRTSLNSNYISTECTTKTGLNVVIVEKVNNEQASGGEVMSQASDAGCPTCACGAELADAGSRSFLQRLGDYFRPRQRWP